MPRRGKQILIRYLYVFVFRHPVGAVPAPGFKNVIRYLHTATTFPNASILSSSTAHSGRFARTTAAAICGHTAFPHRATCWVFGYGFPV